MPDDIRWIRSYVLEEGGGSVGTVCIYQATSPEAIRRHASVADLPVDEIIAVADTVIAAARPAAGGGMSARRLAVLVVLPALVLAGAALAGGGTSDAKPATARFHDLDTAIAAGYSFRLPELSGNTCITAAGRRRHGRAPW